MITWQTVQRRVAIAGRVVDEPTGRPMAGAVVTIDGAPLRSIKTRTRTDGLFYFMDLPDGAYTVSASDPGSGTRYGTSQAEAAVSRDAEENIKASFVTLALRPTVVAGKVTAANRDKGVVMAEIRVKGSGERAFSDARGQFVLAGIEPGRRTILVSARDYQPLAEVVTLERGASKSLSFALNEQSQPGSIAPNAAAHKGRTAGKTP